MDEKRAIIGIIMIVTISLASYLVVSGGATGAAIGKPYISCCCRTIAGGAEQTIVSTELTTFSENCASACTERYSRYGKVFAENGKCD